MEVAGEFLRLFLQGLYFISPLLVLLLLILVLIGQIVGRHEAWSRFDAFYWSFITAFTVGYGDFRPGKRLSKGLSLLIAMVGIIFSGIIVAVALHAAQSSFIKEETRSQPGSQVTSSRQDKVQAGPCL